MKQCIFFNAVGMQCPREVICGKICHYHQCNVYNCDQPKSFHSKMLCDFHMSNNICEFVNSLSQKCSNKLSAYDMERKKKCCDQHKCLFCDKTVLPQNEKVCGDHIDELKFCKYVVDNNVCQHQCNFFMTECCDLVSYKYCDEHRCMYTYPASGGSVDNTCKSHILCSSKYCKNHTITQKCCFDNCDNKCIHCDYSYVTKCCENHKCKWNCENSSCSDPMMLTNSYGLCDFHCKLKEFLKNEYST